MLIVVRDEVQSGRVATGYCDGPAQTVLARLVTLLPGLNTWAVIWLPGGGVKVGPVTGSD